MNFVINNSGSQQPATLSFRWCLQPCSPLGGIDSSASPSPKSQTIPVTWLLYRRDDDEDDKSDGNANGGGFDDERDFVNLYSSIEQGKRSIAVLRELSDSHFVVSGYLLKQSQKDPNVWRRMYFVLSEYRLWVIGRVRQEFRPIMMWYRHRGLEATHINLFRSILVEREEPLTSSSHYSPHLHIPLSVRVTPSEHSTHNPFVHGRPLSRRRFHRRIPTV